MSLLEKARKSVFTRLQNGNLKVENAVVIWTNFAGKPTAFNPAGGKRTFSLVLNEEVGEILKEEGWNVKFREPKLEGDDTLITTEIVVNMDAVRPPLVKLYTKFKGRGKETDLVGDMVGQLDNIQIENIDVVVRPYNHGRPGLYSVKGYAQEIRVIQAQDGYFDDKYADWGSDDDFDEEVEF